METAANWQPFFLLQCPLRPEGDLVASSKIRGLCKILIFLDENLESDHELT
jgi:hypothetical protein